MTCETAWEVVGRIEAASGTEVIALLRHMDGCTFCRARVKEFADTARDDPQMVATAKEMYRGVAATVAARLNDPETKP